MQLAAIAKQGQQAAHGLRLITGKGWAAAGDRLRAVIASLDACLLSVVGHAFLEAVEECVVLEEVEVRVAVQVALPGVVVKLVDRVQRVDHFGGHVDKGLHAGEHPLMDLHPGVYQ